MAKYNTLTALFTAIANALRGKTGGTGAIVADDFPDVINGLSTGGITPTGTKTITSNGTHDVTSFALAKVEVPASGITPSGTKTISENGTYDVTSFANALVNVQGLNARVFTSTVSADATSGTPTISPANEWIASIRSNPNAFVFVRYVDVKGSSPMFAFWFAANFKFVYNGTTGYNAVVLRQTASAASYKMAVGGLTAENYQGNLSVASNGRLYITADSTYGLRAGTYQIVAGTLEMV